MAGWNEIPATNWCWVPDWQSYDQNTAHVVYFRKRIYLNEVPESVSIRMTADSAYKLYVNGIFAEKGPSKGDKEVWFADKVELASYLRAGENVIAVEVLRYAEAVGKGMDSVVRTPLPSLYIEELPSAAGLGLATISGYKCHVAENISFRACNPGFDPLKYFETAAGDASCAGWKLAGFDTSKWSDTKNYTFVEYKKQISPLNLKDRTIPYCRKVPGKFVGLYGKQDQVADADAFSQMLAGCGSVTIPANTKEYVEINAGEEMCGYLSLRMKGGAGARITLLCSEGYAQDHPGIMSLPEEYREFGSMMFLPIKGDRLDYETGRLQGNKEAYTVAGFGSDRLVEEYSPFWFRTFRFIGMTIETGEEALEITGFDYLETGYPLEPVSKVETSDPSLADIWDISLRTLKRCMHETYMDCPFYEQLQYAMDSRNQIMFTYGVAADDRLARKCMDDFRNSQRHDGVINSCYPNDSPNVIPGFSIYYLWMLHDHMMYFGDQAFLRTHAAAADRVLEFFADNLMENGLVGKIGESNRSQDDKYQYWSFIDWAVTWDSGVPNAHKMDTGALTMESMLYLLGLQKMAEVMDYIGRSGLAEEYRGRAEVLAQAINTYCRDEEGVYIDGPGVKEYSVHCQIFAILTGIVDRETGGKLLLTALDDKDKYAQLCVATMLYLFRALEIVGAYEETNRCWDMWRDMIDKHVTTCVENDTDARSDCHAWGSVALYELPSVILGVRPAAPGYKKATIAPIPGYLTWAKGTAATPHGPVQVSWSLNEDGSMELDYEVPEGIEVV